MHQAAEIKLQGKALGGKNKLVVCCIMCVCVCLTASVCVFERLEKKRRGTQGGIKRKKRRMKRGVKGWGWKESGSKKKGEGEEANWASVHMHTSPPPIRVTHPPPSAPSYNTSPSISDVYSRRGMK